MDKISCKIYRCSKQAEMYLYIHKDKTTADLPQDLIAQLKRLTPVMDLELSAERKLARKDVLRVIKNLKAQGFHLQMPPVRRNLSFIKAIKPYVHDLVLQKNKDRGHIK